VDRMQANTLVMKFSQKSSNRLFVSELIPI
jgi:hypothetical protein